MADNINHVGYERRLALVDQILRSRGLQPSNISTIAYTEDWPYPFNNFLYKVELAAPASSSAFPGTQPGTVEAPSEGVSTLVIKLSNLAADGMNNTNRVENDVAVQHLVRQSLAHAGLPPLVPAVYAWAPATTADAADESGFGWITSELKSGVDLDSQFSALELADKEQVLEQIAAALGAIQAARLPESVTKFGGLTFDPSGQIVGGEAPALKGDPIASYVERSVARLRVELEDAARSPVIQGWKSNGVDIRIEKFLTSGGPEKILAGVEQGRLGLVHGDFTTNNMLFDKDTKKLTGVLDFDWSSVAHPFDEFGSALSDIGCNASPDNPIGAAILSGDFTTQPAGLDEESTGKWEVARAWNTAMKKRGVVTPSNIQGVDGILDLRRFRALLSPYQISSEIMLKRIDDNKKAELRAKTEADLVQWLEKHGF